MIFSDLVRIPDEPEREQRIEGRKREDEQRKGEFE
jgi:hypothetical protein